MTEWWRGAVVYQIYPRSFLDASGDGVGDLAGIADRLDHAARLGADAVWISPFFRSPQKDFGYDVADYRDVDPLFGTLADADRLIARAHGLGLRVIVDMVLSHTSDEHPWYRESRSSRTGPKADWYVWADPKPDGTPPNNWLSVFGGPAWRWESRRGQYVLHNFLESQPDLNLRNREVQDAVLAECRFWLDRGVDGFRLDAANFYTHDAALRDNPPRPADVPLSADAMPGNPYFMQLHRYDKSQPETLAFLKRLRGLLDEYPGDRVAIAEIADDEPLVRTIEYTAAGLLHTAYNFTFLARAFDPELPAAAMEEFARAGADAWPCWAFSNHDVARVASRWAPAGTEPGDPRLAKLFLALLCALRGTVFLYQGEELGLPEADIPFEKIRDPYGLAFWPEFRGRDGARTPMPWRAGRPHGGFTEGAEPWLPVPDAHLARAVDAQEADPGSVLSFCRELLAWRRSRPAMVLGDAEPLPAAPGCVAFRRPPPPSAPEAAPVVCVFNTTDRPAEAALPGRLRAAGPGVGAEVSASGDGTRVRLPAFGAAFLEPG
jgi:alpha-glucosidase